MVEACEKIFQEFKDKITPDPVLNLWEGTNSFVVYCDASRIGSGCVFMKIIWLLPMIQGYFKSMRRIIMPMILS